MNYLFFLHMYVSTADTKFLAGDSKKINFIISKKSES